MKSIFKRIIQSSLLSLFSIIIFLLLIEVVIRIFYPQTIDLMEKSNTLKIKLRPNYRSKSSYWRVAINTNSIGLRDREFGEKKQGVFRILVVGDSQTFGHGIEAEDTYPKVLERLLAKNIPNKKIEVINAGVGGYCTFQEFQYLKESGFALEPDLVLVGFFIGNDFGENNAFSVIKFTERKSYNELDLFLSSKSHAYNFFKNRFYKFLAKYTLMNMKKDNIPKVIKIGGEDIYFPNPMTFCKKNYTPDMTKAAEITKRKLLEMANSIREHKSKILLVIIPAMHQVYEEEWHKSSKVYNLNPNGYDISKPNTMLTQFAESEGMPVLDLLPYFLQLAEHKRLYLWEGHLSK
ncbi:MAG: hypothetical protein A2W05_00990, partial [Candidatus Schekmanbacteria bacterium RBG_16_38_10]